MGFVYGCMFLVDYQVQVLVKVRGAASNLFFTVRSHTV